MVEASDNAPLVGRERGPDRRSSRRAFYPLHPQEWIHGGRQWTLAPSLACLLLAQCWPSPIRTEVAHEPWNHAEREAAAQFQ